MSEEAEDQAEASRAYRAYFLTLLRVEWGQMTPREARRFRRRYPLIAFSLKQLADLR